MKKYAIINLQALKELREKTTSRGRFKPEYINGFDDAIKLICQDESLYVSKLDSIDTAILGIQNYEEPNYSSVEQLTILQEELGYKKGEVSTVAMLGLVGEAGEVLSEIGFIDNCSHYAILPTYIADAKSICQVLETYKKTIRQEVSMFVPKFTIQKDREQSFDLELSDVFYNINALAINRGLTIFDLAQMAHDKIRAHQAAGGSSEDPKNK